VEEQTLIACAPHFLPEEEPPPTPRKGPWSNSSFIKRESLEANPGYDSYTTLLASEIGP